VKFVPKYNDRQSIRQALIDKVKTVPTDVNLLVPVFTQRIKWVTWCWFACQWDAASRVT